jgi:hypothetical protein
MFNKYEINKKNNFNVIYSNEYLISDFISVHNIDNIFDASDICDDIKQELNNDTDADNLVNIKLNNMNYSCINNKNLIIKTYINNQIVRNYLDEIENKYSLDKNCLIIPNVYYINNIHKIFKTLGARQNNFEFILIININSAKEDFIKFDIMPSKKININKNEALLFCNRLSFEFNIENIDENDIFIICPIKYYEGYNKLNHNVHPNLKLLA